MHDTLAVWEAQGIAAGVQAWIDRLRDAGTGTAAIAAARTTLRIAAQEAVRLGLLAECAARRRSRGGCPMGRTGLVTPAIPAAPAPLCATLSLSKAVIS